MPETPNNLRAIRRGRDLTQAQLADLVGVDATTISDIERGKNRNPSWETVSKLSRVLERAPDELFPVQPAAVPAEERA